MIEKEVAKGRNPWPKEVHLQTRTLAYNRMFWVSVERMERQWEDCRIDAQVTGGNSVTISTKNVRVLALNPERFKSGGDVKSASLDALVDGQQVKGVKTQLHGFYSGYLSYFYLEKHEGKWRELQGAQSGSPYFTEKQGFRSGPIDDAFKGRFVVIGPDAPANDEVARWSSAEFAHFQKRWRGLMRGDAIVKTPANIRKGSEMTDASIVLWGTPSSNSMVRELFTAGDVPFQWDKESIHDAGKAGISVPAKGHALAMVYPSPYGRGPYIVLNSGLTFREAHDRTNSLQNPKLPDWAILDITQPPSAESAGKVVAADFFDEHWKVKPEMPPVDAK
jgi:hypothetical protein